MQSQQHIVQLKHLHDLDNKPIQKKVFIQNRTGWSDSDMEFIDIEFVRVYLSPDEQVFAMFRITKDIESMEEIDIQQHVFISANEDAPKFIKEEDMLYGNSFIEFLKAKCSPTKVEVYFDHNTNKSELRMLIVLDKTGYYGDTSRSRYQNATNSCSFKKEGDTNTSKTLELYGSEWAFDSNKWTKTTKPNAESPPFEEYNIGQTFNTYDFSMPPTIVVDLLKKEINILPNQDHSGGGARARTVAVCGKRRTAYVKVGGRFMTVAAAEKHLARAAKSKNKSKLQRACKN